MGLSFEWTVKLGDLLTLISAIVVVAAFLHRRGGHEADVHSTLKGNTEQLKEVKDELKEVRTEFKEIGETLKKVAVQEVQIGLLMKWYDELRHGQGFVQNGVRGIDREYP